MRKYENNLFNKILLAVFALAFLCIPAKALSANFEVTTGTWNPTTGAISVTFPDDGGTDGTRAGHFGVSAVTTAGNGGSGSGWDSNTGGVATWSHNTGAMSYFTGAGFTNAWWSYTPNAGGNMYYYQFLVGGVATDVDNSGPGPDGITEVTTPTAIDDYADGEIPHTGQYTNAIGLYDNIEFQVLDVATSTTYTGYRPAVMSDDYAYSFITYEDFNKQFSVRYRLSDSTSVTAPTDWTTWQDFLTLAFVPTDEPPIEEETCPDGTIANAFSILCHIKNGLVWAFVPTQASLRQFSTLTLRDSKPFSYIYDVGNLYNELFSNSGSMDYDVSVTTSLGDITFISADMIEDVPYAGFIKTILGYMMWLFTAFALYRIIINVHDKSKTHV